MENKVLIYNKVDKKLLKNHRIERGETMYGILTLLPPVLTIFIALWKKDIVAALFLGIVSASLITNGIHFISQIVNVYMARGWEKNSSLLILILLIGIMLEQINKSGGFLALSSYMKKRIKTARGAKLFAWVLCMVCATDDGMATMGAGSIAKPVIDSFQIPRERLAFIISSTAPNFLSMMPYSMYIIFGTGLLAPYVTAGTEFSIYMHAVRYNAYALLSILTAGLFAAEILPDFKSMRQAKGCAAALKGEDGIQGETKGDIWMLLIPFGTMAVSFLVTYIQTGGFLIQTAALSGCIAIFVYSLFRKKLKFREISGICFEGVRSTAPLLVILFMAFSFAQSVESIGFGEYVATLLEGKVMPSLLPVCIFLLCCIVAYCTGSFASSMTIMVPLAVPLCISSGSSLPLVFAACMGGSQFGDQTSPISDIFILSSMSAGVDVSLSARVQTPYKVSMMMIAALIFLLLGFWL